ncbi:MAG: response regulator [Myxococcales bacterium]|nr:response regulator [Myxococcales bacterium]
MSAGAILVIEDNPVTRKMLRVVFQAEGFAVLDAPDAETALSTVEKETPALILQDLLLPDMDGIELVRRLRARPSCMDVPILALSGFLTKLEEARTIGAGFTAFLVKPIEPSRLVEIVRTYLPHDEKRPAPVAQGQRVLIADDDAVQLKLLRLQLANAGFQMSTAEDGSQALAQALADPPDAIVADILMPGLDGFELCLKVRRDPMLGRIPIVLLSFHYLEDADQELARKVGASGLLLRSTDPDELCSVILASIKAGPPPVPTESITVLKGDHAVRVARQLERQSRLNAGLAQRCAQQAAELSLLCGVAGALAKSADYHSALRDVLATCLDAAGISMGALLLSDEAGSLHLIHVIGYPWSDRARIEAFFGHAPLLRQALETKASLAIPSPSVPVQSARDLLSQAGATSLLVVPLLSGGRRLGVLVVGSRKTDMTGADQVAFASALASQIGQTVALTMAFARVTRSEQRYRALMEHASDGIAVLSEEGRILEANVALERLTGLKADELVGRPWLDLAPPEEHPRLAADLEKLRAQGKVRASEVRLPTAGGRRVIADVSASVVDAGGERLILAVLHDVTETKKLHEQVMVSDRMASVGMMAAGVAHEINNPLSAVVANLDLAIRDLDELGKEAIAPPRLEDFGEELREAREATDRVRLILRDLKIFSRAEQDKREAVDVHRVLDSSLRMAWNEIRHRAELVKDYQKVPLVDGNESRLGQVFLNLIVNAAQAMQEGRAESNQIRVRTGTDSAGRVVVEVADTGPGMTPEVLGKLFTPFFTTKPPGVGSGLGLSICHRIVTNLGGEISVQSQLGKGSVFRVALLPAKGEEETGQRVAAPARAASRRGRVMVVDDEPMIGKAVRRTLSNEHEIVAETSAAAALERIQRGERFDVILCDLMMPAMTGMDLYAAIQKLEPEQASRMVFLTGGAFTPRARAFLDETPNQRMEKPFDTQNLRALVNERVR